jgi:5-methylcytosine-specific restriction endonuclease McrBC regulatory subunit McrC
LFNLKSTTEELKEEHRKDLHQLLAYTTFTRSENKIGILCYPYSQQYLSELNYFSPFSQIGSTVLLVGVPMQKSKINDFKKLILENLSKIEVDNLV